MISLVLVDQQGATVSPQNLATASELHEAVEKARALIRECERLARLKANPKAVLWQGGVPYSS